MPDTTPLIRSLADVLADLERERGFPRPAAATSEARSDASAHCSAATDAGLLGGL